MGLDTPPAATPREFQNYKIQFLHITSLRVSHPIMAESELKLLLPQSRAWWAPPLRRKVGGAQRVPG